MGFFKFVPNFYIILVGPPGIATKTTAIRMGSSLARSVPGVKYGPAAMTWQVLPKILKEGIEVIKYRGKNQVTCSASFAVSELGTLIDPGDKNMIDMLVDIWDANDEAWEKRTKGSGDDKVYNPWINIIAGTTPAWLSEHYPKQMLGGGFTSRCVFAYSDRKDKLVAYPKDLMTDSREALRPSLIHDLGEINKISGEYSLSKEAKEWGVEWYHELYKNPPKIALGEDQAHGYLSRKQALVHKLAIVQNASKTDELEISLRTLQDAATIFTSLEQGMAKVFESIYATRTQEVTGRIVDIVRNSGNRAMMRDLVYRTVWKQVTLKDFNAAVDSAVAAGKIETGWKETTQGLVRVLVFKGG